MDVTIEIDDLGTLLLLWRTQAHLTVRDAAKLASIPLGRGVSHNTVSRYETNRFPKEGPDPAVLVALVFALGHRWTDLPESYRKGVEKYADLLARSRCWIGTVQRAA